MLKQLQKTNEELAVIHKEGVQMKKKQFEKQTRIRQGRA